MLIHTLWGQHEIKMTWYCVFIISIDYEWLTTFGFIRAVGTVDHTITLIVTMDATSCLTLELTISTRSCSNVTWAVSNQSVHLYCLFTCDELTWWPQVDPRGEVGSESFPRNWTVCIEPHCNLIGCWEEVMGGAISCEDSWVRQKERSYHLGQRKIHLDVFWWG